MSNIVCLGWYGEGNVGDEAFKLVLQQQLVGNQLACVEKVGHAAFTPDVVIFGGGGVVCDWYFKGLTQTQPLYALGVDLDTAGPRYAQWASYNFKQLYCRSVNYTRDLKNMGKPVTYCPDLAFGLNFTPTPFVAGPKKRIAITLTNELTRNPAGLAAIVDFVDRLDSGWEVHFVSFYCGTPNSLANGAIPDSKIHAQVLPLIKKPMAEIVIQDSYQDPVTMLNYLSQMDILLTMRFHGLIFGTMLGVPFLSISGTGKNALYCTQEALPDRIVDITTVTANSLERAFYNTLQNNSYLSKQLLMIATANKVVIQDMFESVRNTWLSPTA